VRVLPFRCISMTGAGRPCWRPVAVAGQRCDRCWGELVVSPGVANRLELAAEAELPGWVASKLAGDGEAMVRVVVAGRGDLSPAVLGRLAVDADPGVRAALAANAASPAEADALLALDPDPDVVVRLATRATTAPAVLALLCTHGDRRVRGGVAGNPATTGATERELACRERDPVVLAALAAKASTSKLVLSWLAQHPQSGVSGPARRILAGHGGAASAPQRGADPLPPARAPRTAPADLDDLTGGQTDQIGERRGQAGTGG